jgi:aldehyde dehydrogenase (NAD+)
MLRLLDKFGLSAMNSGVSAGIPSWSPKFSNEILSSLSPTTDEIIAAINPASGEDLKSLIQQSHETYLRWRQVPAPQRGEVIRLIGNELRSAKEDLARLISSEMGKIYQEALGEVQEMIDMADFAVGQSRMLYGKTMPSERPEHRMFEQWHPLGVIGVISAFNFPVAVWAWNAFIAAICGNTVIWKPSPKVPLTALAVQKICERVMTQTGHEGIFSIFITQDVQLANYFVAEPLLPLISFTGSVAIGRTVYETVAHRLGRCLLELSGNNAMIVDETANLELAIPAILFAAVGTSGQRCTSLRRLIVHESKYPQLIEKLKYYYQQIKIGDPMDPQVLMGPLIDQFAVENYNFAITAAKNAGGEVLFGGHPLDCKGYFVEPTIIRAENHWDIVQQETFSPILYIMTYRDLSEAIRLQNGVKQGLSSCMFTESLKHAEYFLSVSGSDCGIANINIGPSGAEIGGAFGGEKETGGGREAGSDSWKAYMRQQSNTINWSNQLPLAQGIKFEFVQD